MNVFGNIRFNLVIALLLLYCSIPVFSQPKTLSYHFQSYDISKGLSSYNVQRIIQDQLGFTWIATQDGLNYFDGHDFKVFRNRGEFWKKIGDNVVVDLCTHPESGDIYICLPYKGIEKINKQTLAIQTVMDEKAIAQYFTNDLITNIAFNLNGSQLWIGGDGSFAVINTKNGALAYASKNDPLLASANIDRVKKIIPTALGITYVLTRNGQVYVYESATLTYKATISLPGKSLQVNDACLSSDNTIFLATSGGIMNMDYPQMGKTLFPGQYIRAIHKDYQNNTWFATADGLFKQTPGNLYSIQPTLLENKSWLSTINSLNTDEFDNIWIGTKQGVLVSAMTETPFHPYSTKEQSSDGLGHIYNLVKETNTTLLLSTEDGLFRLHLISGATTAIGDKTVTGPAFRGPNNEMLVSQYNSLYRVDNNNLLPAEITYPVLSEINDDLMGSFLRIGDSMILLGSDKENGLYCWKYKKNSLVHLQEGGPPGKSIGSNIVNFIKPIPNTNTVLVGSDKNLSILNLADLSTRVITLAASNKEPYKYYFDFYAGKGNFYIAIHQMGLIITDTSFGIKELITTENGLTDNAIYCLQPEGDSALWVSSNKGLTRISLNSHKTRQFFIKDGLHNDSFEEFSSIKTGNNIYFGGVGGLTGIEPDKLTNTPERLPLYLTNCIMITSGSKIDSVVTGLNKLEIPNFVNQTNIHFAAIHYPAFKGIYYQYRFGVTDTSWLPNGQQNFITLMGMSPGQYKLGIRASRNNLDWGAPLFMDITVMPKWYQTTLFKVMIALTLFGLVFLFYVNRLKQLEAQQNIRKEIASDLHDDLGSTLNSLKVLTHLAKSNPQHLEQIESSLSTATGGLRDMIWVLDDTEDSVGELVARISKTVLPTLTALNINFIKEIDTNTSEEKISKLEKKNMLLIIKEAINNSIKYAQCQNISLSIRKQHGKLLVNISDDGIGFDHEIVNKGYGLQNMKSRAQQLSYSIKIESLVPKGTIISLVQS